MLDYYALSQLATKITGRKWVNVEFQRPPWAGFSGAAMANPGGEFTIYLDPLLSEADQYKIYLHECAHVNLHGARMVPITTQELQAAPQANRPETDIKADYLAQLEREADSLADIWDRIAQRDAGWNSPITQRLQALYDHR